MVIKQTMTKHQKGLIETTSNKICSADKNIYYAFIGFLKCYIWSIHNVSLRIFCVCMHFLFCLLFTMSWSIPNVFIVMWFSCCPFFYFFFILEPMAL